MNVEKALSIMEKMCDEGEIGCDILGLLKERDVISVYSEKFIVSNQKAA